MPPPAPDDVLRRMSSLACGPHTAPTRCAAVGVDGAATAPPAEALPLLDEAGADATTTGAATGAAAEWVTLAGDGNAAAPALVVIVVIVVVAAIALLGTARLISTSLSSTRWNVPFSSTRSTEGSSTNTTKPKPRDLHVSRLYIT